MVVKEPPVTSLCGPFEIEVEVSHCGFSGTDVAATTGQLPEIVPGAESFVPGHSGVVGKAVRVGTALDHLRPGQRVAGMLPLSEAGSLRQRLRADGRHFVALPEAMDDALAAALVEPLLFGVAALRYGGAAVRGQSVLVLDAATPAGEVAVQLGRHWELQVMAHCRSAAEATLLEARYRELVVVVEHDHDDEEAILQQVLRRTGGIGVDIVLEGRPQEPRASSWWEQCVAPRGRLVQWGGPRPQPLQLDPPATRALALRAATLAWEWPQAWLLFPLHTGRLMQLLHICVSLMPTMQLSQIDRFPLARLTSARQAATHGEAAVIITLHP